MRAVEWVLAAAMTILTALAFWAVLHPCPEPGLPGTHTVYEDGSYRGCLPNATCND